MGWFAWVVLGLIGGRWVAQWSLDMLNRWHIFRHADKMPEAFRGVLDPSEYGRSVEYSLAKNRFGRYEDAFSAVLLVVLLLSGFLPWFFEAWRSVFGESVWSGAGFLESIVLGLGILGLPWGWYAQFRLEERFGFNTTTPATWWIDRVKGAVLLSALGLPLLALVLKLVDWTGAGWWFWAWCCVLGFQSIMLVLAPVIILPWFNRFTPLPEGGLRDRLMALAGRTGFHAQSIQVMDGSKRSRHSNAFFTGLGRFRKIVLFDTLVAQLTDEELEAVLAHEIGHFRRRHFMKMLCWSAAVLLASLAVVAWLAERSWFLGAFGFESGELVPAFLIFGLLSGPLSFWLGPVTNLWSRRYEYEADRFASTAMGRPEPLVEALRKLNAKNLSNLTPHPVYSAFYYSHPTLIERESALLSPAAG